MRTALEEADIDAVELQECDQVEHLVVREQGEREVAQASFGVIDRPPSDPMRSNLI